MAPPPPIGLNPGAVFLLDCLWKTPANAHIVYSGTSDNGHSKEWTTSLQWTNCYPLPLIFTSEEGTTPSEQWTSPTCPLFGGSTVYIYTSVACRLSQRQLCKQLLVSASPLPRDGLQTSSLLPTASGLSTSAQYIQWNLQTRDNLGQIYSFVPCREVVPISEVK